MYRVQYKYPITEFRLGEDAMGRRQRSIQLPAVHFTEADALGNNLMNRALFDKHRRVTRVIFEEEQPMRKIASSPRKRSAASSSAGSGKRVHFDGTNKPADRASVRATPSFALNAFDKWLQVRRHLYDNPSDWTCTSKWVSTEDAEDGDAISDLVGEEQYLSSRAFVLPTLEFLDDRGVVWMVFFYLTESVRTVLMVLFRTIHLRMCTQFASR